MAIDQLSDGRWKLDVEPIKGKRFRKTFKTKGEAQRFEASCRAKVVENPDWSPRPKDRRTLAELVGLWFDLHGHSLRDGERRRSKLDALAKRLRNPQGSKLDPQAYAQDRRIRLGEGASPKTLNNELGYLRAVYNELRGLGVIGCRNNRVDLLGHRRSMVRGGRFGTIEAPKWRCDLQRDQVQQGTHRADPARAGSVHS